MAKGEPQKRLSLATIEKAALLFLAKNDFEHTKQIPDFVFFLELVNDEGLPAVRKMVLEQHSAKKKAKKD